VPAFRRLSIKPGVRLRRARSRSSGRQLIAVVSPPSGRISFKPGQQSLRGSGGCAPATPQNPQDREPAGKPPAGNRAPEPATQSASRGAFAYISIVHHLPCETQAEGVSGPGRRGASLNPEAAWRGSQASSRSQRRPGAAGCQRARKKMAWRTSAFPIQLSKASMPKNSGKLTITG
jgi:hypothetical protein